MEQVIQVTGLCVVGALLALVVKRGSPETALLLAVGAAVVVALALAGVVKELLAFLGELGSASGVSADLFVPLYKTIGIALVVQVGGNLCRDAGESALASVVETAGTLCALLAALPLLRALLGTAAASLLSRRRTAGSAVAAFAAARAAGHTALFAAALVEELDALGLDFGGVAVLPLLILPFAGLQAAFHKHEAALGQVLGAVRRRFLEHHDAVPLGTVHTVAVAVRVGFVRGDVERADGAAALGIAQFGIAAEPADDHNLVQHSNSLQDAL